MHLDAKGLIVQSTGDGGDTLQREGFWFEGAHLVDMEPSIPPMKSYEDALTVLYTPQGFERSWQAPYNDPSDTSRDQLVSNIRAMGYYNYTKQLNFILLNILKNWSRFPNGDIAFINDYGRFIRAFRAWYLYPLLFLFDVPLIVNSVLRCVIGRDSNNVGDDINHIGDLAQAQNIYATPTSWVARLIYKHFRPSFTSNISGPQYALNWYFRPESGGNPEFALLWSPIVAKF